MTYHIQLKETFHVFFCFFYFFFKIGIYCDLAHPSASTYFILLQLRRPIIPCHIFATQGPRTLRKILWGYLAGQDELQRFLRNQAHSWQLECPDSKGITFLGQHYILQTSSWTRRVLLIKQILHLRMATVNPSIKLPALQIFYASFISTRVRHPDM